MNMASFNTKIDQKPRAIHLPENIKISLTRSIQFSAVKEYKRFIKGLEAMDIFTSFFTGKIIGLSFKVKC